MKRAIGVAAALWLLSAGVQADPGPTDEHGCHGGPAARHCHGGGGASGESLLVVAAAVAGAAYLVRKEWDNRRLRQAAASQVPVLQRYDDNGNGRISCREARRHGIAPAAREHPAYPYIRDLDRDGIACEGRGLRPVQGLGGVSEAPESPLPSP